MFPFFAVAVEVKNVDIVESLQQAVAHTAEGGIIEIAVICDERDDATSCLLDVPLGKTYEFYVVIA